MHIYRLPLGASKKVRKQSLSPDIYIGIRK